MQETNVIPEVHEEMDYISNALTTLTDQTQDHLSIVCSILISYLVEDATNAGGVAYANIINHIKSAGDFVPEGLLESCMALYSKLYLVCIANSYLPRVRSVSLVRTRPYLVVKVYHDPTTYGGDQL